MMFWIGAALMVLLTILFLIIPMVWTRKASMKQPAKPPTKPTSRIPHRIIVALMVIIIPGVAISGYSALGTPGMPDFPLAERTDADIQQRKQLLQSERILEMVAGLEKRLKTEPEDLKGWMMLARSYQVLEDFQKSEVAYARAYILAPDDLGLALAYGETLMTTSQGSVPPKALELFEFVLSKEPSNISARLFKGLALSSNENALEGLQIWQEVLLELPKNSELSVNLSKRINQLKQSLAQVQK